MTAKRVAKKKTGAKKKSSKSAPRKTAPKRSTSKATAKKGAKKKAAAKPKVAKKAKVTTKSRAAKKPKVARKSKATAAARKPAAPKKKKAPAARKPRRPRLDLRRFRRELSEKHANLLQAYISTKGDSRTRESDGTEDYIDYAVSSYDREFLLSLTELEQSQLRLVDEALKRLDQGGFGLCVQCEQPIRPKRLDVQPWARYCLRCQELADSGLTGEDGFPSDDEDADASGGDFEDEDETADDERLIRS